MGPQVRKTDSRTSICLWKTCTVTTVYPRVVTSATPVSPIQSRVKLLKTGKASRQRDLRFRNFRLLQADGFRPLVVVPCDISRCINLAKRRAASVATLEEQSHERHYNCLCEVICRLR